MQAEDSRNIEEMLHQRQKYGNQYVCHCDIQRDGDDLAEKIDKLLALYEMEDCCYADIGKSRVESLINSIETRD